MAFFLLEPHCACGRFPFNHSRQMHEPPPDHETFVALRARGFKSLRENHNRRRNPVQLARAAGYQGA